MTQELLAKIRLIDYGVQNFTFESDGFGKEAAAEIQFGMDYHTGSNKENELLKKLDLVIRINEDEVAYKETGFRIAIVIYGIFEFDQEMEKEQRDRMLAINGLSMLFSTARGIVAQLTAQTPQGKFILPSINIAEFLRIRLEEKAKEGEEALMDKSKGTKTRSGVKKQTSGTKLNQ